MPKKLTADQCAFYAEQGFLSPVSILSSSQVRRYQKELEETERIVGPIRERDKAGKPHLLYPWANQLIREPGVLDAIEDLLGPDILVYQVTLLSKDPHSDTFVSWHQDGTYFSLQPQEQISTWVALSDAPVDAGCLEVLPRSHRLGQLRHVEAASTNNLLSRGQTVAHEVDSRGSVFMPVAPGQMSLHHTHLLHRSGPNKTSHRRIGLVVSYIPAHCRCTADIRMTASLVRGVDKFNHFDPEPAPESVADDRAQAFHREATQRFSALREITSERMR